MVRDAALDASIQGVADVWESHDGGVCFLYPFRLTLVSQPFFRVPA